MPLKSIISIIILFIVAALVLNESLYFQTFEISNKISPKKGEKGQLDKLILLQVDSLDIDFVQIT